MTYSLNAGDWEPLTGGQFISLIEPSPGEIHTQFADPELRFGKQAEGYDRHQESPLFTDLVVPRIACPGAVLMVVVWYRSRIAKIRREQDIRNRIAADLHDEVGSSLTRIFQANALAGSPVAGSPVKAERQGRRLQLIADTSKQALLTMSDMVWSIDSRFDTVKDLLIRKERLLWPGSREELDFQLTGLRKVWK